MLRFQTRLKSKRVTGTESATMFDPTAQALHLTADMPSQVRLYPHLRYMGNKRRLLPWIHDLLATIHFESVLDPFSGSGCVAYLMKTLGKRVVAADFMNFAATVAGATVANSSVTLTAAEVRRIVESSHQEHHFIEDTFTGVFFTPEELRFLDAAWWQIHELDGKEKKQIAISALLRSCLKRQPRGVFTVAGDPSRYKDGRRDLTLTLAEHFVEQVAEYNRCVFDNGEENAALHGSVFDLPQMDVDLVYLDPPYVPRSDDNCYMKRYHFLEGLSCYWQGQQIVQESKVKKITKPYTPFSYRRTAHDAFDQLFNKFSDSIIVLSYSSNGYPDLDDLVHLLGRYKHDVEVHEKKHRYHFGTHKQAKRNLVREFLIIGT